MAGSILASVAIPTIANAIDFNITGFVRQEIAVSVTDDATIVNRSDNMYNFNGRVMPGFGGLDANGDPIDDLTTSSGRFSYQANPGNFGGCGPVGVGNFCDTNGDGLNDDPRATGLTADNDFNLFNTRAELEIQAKISESLAAYMRIRAYFDGTSTFADENQQVEKHFLTDSGFGDNRGNLLEVQNNDAMIDIPSLYADINFGNSWFRVGQQQIAWGEALFFRVFDVANGLDLRRHLFFDVGAEEYADERVASPGVRASYTFSNGWEVDAFVQMFSPTLYPNTNTPYNVILDGFTVGNSKFGKGFDDAENSLNFGARVIMPDVLAKDLTLSVMAVNRRNPDGVFRWDEGGGRFMNMNPADGLGINGKTGAVVMGANPFCNLNSLIGGTATQSDAESSCGHSFELDGTGTNSYQDWWQQASAARFDPVQGAATSIGELSGSNQLAVPNGIGKKADGKFDFVKEAEITAGTQTEIMTIDAAEMAAVTACTATSSCTPATGANRKMRGMKVVSGFFTGFGPLRGHISREYKRENILGASFNYIITADQTSIFDQLIVRGEMSYTIDKTFTDISASTLFTKSDEILASVILEKYQSVFDAIPATYFVFEWMHRTDTDLGGRMLSGYSRGQDLIFEDEDGSPEGVSSADYFVFAFQQPFPNLIWRADFALLADVRGGIFFQPGVRYKPSSEWQFDIYANIAADVGGKNDDLLESFDNMDEVFARVSYYF
ncbi:MAG: hypothetical protein EXR86_06520 [Gammaproteobacteria bacterium]|nr:hypothetical protein [Gammaproteobacteria bacterium]